MIYVMCIIYYTILNVHRYGIQHDKKKFRYRINVSGHLNIHVPHV